MGLGCRRRHTAQVVDRRRGWPVVVGVMHPTVGRATCALSDCGNSLMTHARRADGGRPGRYLAGPDDPGRSVRTWWTWPRRWRAGGGRAPARRRRGSTRTTATTGPHRPPVRPGRPAPRSTGRSAAVLRAADAHGIPITARGSGTRLSGRASPVDGGIVVSFERRCSCSIDTDNHMAWCSRVTLAELDGATAATTSSTRCSPASAAPRSAATSTPTPAACGP